MQVLLDGKFEKVLQIIIIIIIIVITIIIIIRATQMGAETEVQ